MCACSGETPINISLSTPEHHGMPFNWLQTKMKRQARREDANPVAATVSTSPAVFGPVPWALEYDSGLEVVCEGGRDNGLTFSLDHGFLVIGRGRTEEERRKGWLLFTDETVSRRQAVLAWNEEKGCYFLFHLEGATNPTFVDKRAGEHWRIGVGSTVEMGNCRFRVQRRIRHGKPSPFASNLTTRFNGVGDDACVSSGFALTIMNGPNKGDTFILSRKLHVLHDTVDENGHRLLERGQQNTLERDALVWNDEASSYALVHNTDFTSVDFSSTVVYAGRARHGSDLRAAPPEPGVEVVSETPMLLRDGDTIRLGSLRLRLHRNVQCLLEGCVGHIMQKGYIEEIPAPEDIIAISLGTPTLVDAPVAAVDVVQGADAVEPPQPIAASPAPPLPSPDKTVRLPASTLGRTAPPRNLPPLPKRPDGRGDGQQAQVAQAPPPSRNAPVENLEPRPQLPTVEIAIPVRREAVLEQGAAPQAAQPITGPYALEIVIAVGHAPGTRIVLGGASRIDPTTTPLVTVGASPTNQVAFPEDTTLSAAHAVLERSERGLLLRPLDGVSMVNRSICLKEAILHDGDEVRFTRATVVRVLAVD